MNQMANDFIEISAPDLLPENPVLSVHMITYNHEKYLGQAIEGVVSQIVDFPVELVIGEDCSSDRTREIALEYQKKYPSLVRVIYSYKNVGYNRNFSRVLSLCRGKYVATCDGDDIWIDKTKLQQQADFLERNQEYVVCYHDSKVMDDNDNIIKKSNVPAGCKRDYTKYELQRGAFISALTRCFRNVVHSPPDEWFNVLNADRFLITLLGEYGAGHYMRDLEPGVYRHHPGGIWSALAEPEKKAELANTYYWLAVYYQRVGRKDLVNDFIMKMLAEIGIAVKIDNFALIRFAVRHIYRRGLQKVRTYVVSPVKRFFARYGVLSSRKNAE